MHIELEWYQNVGFAGLVIVTGLLGFGLFDAYDFKRKFNKHFLAPATKFVVVVLLLMAAIMSLLELHIVSALAVFLWVPMMWSEVKRNWGDARSEWKWRKQQRKEEQGTFVDRFWANFNAWWERQQERSEKRNERKLIAQQKARIIAERELAAEQEEPLSTEAEREQVS